MAAPVSLAPGHDFDENGDLYVWPENQHAAALWLMIGDQWLWSGGMESKIVGFNMATALEYAREMAKLDPMIQVIPLVQNVRTLAGFVVEIITARKEVR